MDETPIIILTGKVNKKKDLNKFISKLKIDKNFNLKDFLSKLDKKINEHRNLFIKLSKESAKMENLKLLMVERLHTFENKMGAYPSRKEIAIPIA
ncbi:MAG: hypothetical protein LBV42_05235 [Methanobrevibacter sp.]|nr:hypothetical protein [Methanobrevibacter sp.]